MKGHFALVLMLFGASACTRAPKPERGATPEAFCARTLELTGKMLPEITREKIRSGCIVQAQKERETQLDYYVCRSRCATAARDMDAYMGCTGGCETKRRPEPSAK